MFAYTVLGTLLKCLTSQGHPCQPLTPSTRHPHLCCSLCSLFVHCVYPLRHISHPPFNRHVGSITFFTVFSHLCHPPTASSSPAHIPFGALPGCPNSQESRPSLQTTSTLSVLALCSRYQCVRWVFTSVSCVHGSTLNSLTMPYRSPLLFKHNWADVSWCI